MPLNRDIQQILALARRENASDIHIVAGLPPMFRINGEIILSNRPALAREDTASLCFGLLNDEQKKAFKPYVAVHAPDTPEAQAEADKKVAEAAEKAGDPAKAGADQCKVSGG